MALLSLSVGAWAEEETTTTEKDTTYIVNVWTGSVEEEKDTVGVKQNETDGSVTYMSSWWNEKVASSAYIIPEGYTLTLTFNNYTSANDSASDWYKARTSLFVTNNLTQNERNAKQDYFSNDYDQFIAATLDGRTEICSVYSQEGYPSTFAAMSDSLDSAKVTLTIANYDINAIAKAEITTRNGSTMKISWIEDKKVLNDTLRAFLMVDSCYVDSLSSQLVDSVEESFYEGLQLSKAVPYVEDGIEKSTLGSSDLSTEWWGAFSDWYIVPKEYELTISFTNHCYSDTATITYDKYSYLTAVMVCGSKDQANEYIGLTNTGWEWKCIKDTLQQITYKDVKELAQTLNGSTITVTVNNAEDSLSVKMVIVKNDTTMTQVVKREIPDTISTVYARLIPAQSYLTDIESSMKYTRANSGQGAYGTVCMPFDATVDNAKAYEVVGYGTDANGNPEKLYLDSVSTCEAGKGYVFLTTSTNSIVFNVTGTTMVDEPSDGALVGTFSDSIFVDSCDYILTTSTTSSYVWGKGKGNYIKRYRAYLDSAYVFDNNNFAPITSNTANAKGYIMFSIITDGDDNTTGIQEIVSDEQNGEADDIIYNLSGIRVTNPQKGIYIKNGKKYIIK